MDFNYKLGDWVRCTFDNTFGRVAHFDDDEHQIVYVAMAPGAEEVDSWPEMWWIEDPSDAEPFIPTPEQEAEYAARTPCPPLWVDVVADLAAEEFSGYYPEDQEGKEQVRTSVYNALRGVRGRD
jgi:hypothetical protein